MKTKTNGITKFAGTLAAFLLAAVATAGAFHLSASAADGEETTHTHTYNNEGFCTVQDDAETACGAYQPATKASDGIYEIGNAGQLYWFAAVVNSGYGDTAQNRAINVRLIDDIKLNETVLSDGKLIENTDSLREWTPIGASSANSYQGRFYGNEHTVRGVYVNRAGQNNIGFFGYVQGTSAHIYDLTLTDSYICGQENVGGIVGCSWPAGAEISACSSTATVVGKKYVGGIAGKVCTGAIIGEIKNCVHGGTVFGQNYVGGIVGTINRNNVVGCANLGTVECSNTSGAYVGGIVGELVGAGTSGASIARNCYAGGTIKGYGYIYIRIGGIAGCANANGLVQNCFSDATFVENGEVNGQYGALVGDLNKLNTVTDSYYDRTTATHAFANLSGAYNGMTDAQISSGQVAYLLGSAWGQTIGTDPKPILNGKTVYAIEGTSCVGTPSGTYTYSNSADAEGESGVHKRNDYNYCTLCEVAITGASITVGQDLTMRYYVSLYKADLLWASERLAMRFTMNGKSVLVGEYTIENGEYVFAFTGIAPQCMGERIDAELLRLRPYGDGEVDITCATKKGYSVKANAEALLAAYGEETDDSSRALVQFVTDLLTYGAAAQNYKDYNVDNLANGNVSGLGTPSDALPDGTDRNLTTHAETLGNVCFSAVSVWFDNVNKIVLSLNSAENAKLIVKIGDRTVGEYTDLDTTFRTDAIHATDFGTVYTFELYENDTLVQTLTYSVNSYVYAMMDKIDEDGQLTQMAVLARALYRYGASAVAYRNAVAAQE